MSARRGRDTDPTWADPIRIDQALDEVASELGAAPVSAVEIVSDALRAWWSSIDPAGAAGPGAVMARSLVDAELVVVAGDPRVANELRYRRDELVACLRALPIAEPVRRVRIVVGSDR
jgi:hypothetical protein